MLSDKLTLSGFDEDTKKYNLQVYREFLTERWTDNAMYMNYLEGMQFASSCVDLLVREGELKIESMERILTKQASVMTVRGSARDEYITSMELSRL
jgi:ribosomal protein S3AE